MNKRYYWLRLKENFFKDKRIKKLRSIAGGDTYTIIYLKMQLLSLQDEGYLYFENIEETFEEEIALDIDEDIENVKVVINFLKNTELLKEIDKNIYELTETRTCIGSEGSSAERVRKFREKQSKMLQCNTSVTKCNTEKEKEKEKEIYKEKINKKEIEEEFEEIWKQYPRKVGKEKSLNYYIKARKEGVTKEVILNAVINYAEKNRNTNIKYIKHGSTWFNGKYWEDEIEKVETEEERIKRLEKEIREEEENEIRTS